MEAKTPVERISIFQSHPFFALRPGLPESLMTLELNTGIKIPYNFKVGFHSYNLGDVELEIGKIHQDYFYFGIKMEQDWFFMSFRNSNELKLFINNLALIEGEDGKKMEREHIIFLLKEIDEFPKRL